MAAYLTKDEFKAITLMPADSVEGIETSAPGWIDAQLERWSRWMDSRLIKRYPVPWTAPIPFTITEWLARIVTVRCFLKRGIDPDDLQWQLIKADCDQAVAEIAEAADSETGKFELPVRADNVASAISKGGPFGYSEQSPYVWTDLQSATGSVEDSNGTGSGS